MLIKFNKRLLCIKQIASPYNALIASTYNPVMTRLFCKSI